MTRRVLPLVLVALLAGALPASAQSPATTEAPGASAGPRALAMGMTIQAARNQAAYDAVVEELGHAPAIWSFWADWGDLDEAGCPGPRTTPLPDTALLAHMREQGTVPLIIWQPVDSTRLDEPLYTYEKIATGAFDCYLRSFAEGVAAIDGPVLLRFAHEFDGYWFPWGMGRFTNTPETFVPAWRHVWEVIKGSGGQVPAASGAPGTSGAPGASAAPETSPGASAAPEASPSAPIAPNARFVWSPLGCDCPDEMLTMFPGERYVDYLGLTAFNWASFHTDNRGRPVRWQRLAEIVGRRLGGFDELPPIPVILTEIGSHYRGGNKARWITNGYNALVRRFPQVVAAMYFDVDMTTLNDPKHPENWLLTRPRDGSALRAYKRLLARPEFQGRLE